MGIYEEQYAWLSRFFDLSVPNVDGKWNLFAVK